MLTHFNAALSLDLLLRLCLAGLFLLALALVLTSTLLRRASAATRHLTWTAACLSLLCLPAFSLIPTPANLPPSLAPIPRLTASIPKFRMDTPLDTAPIPSPGSVSRFTFSDFVVPLYAFGLLTTLTPLLLSPILLRRLKRHSAPCTDEAVLTALSVCQRSLTIPHPILLLVSDSPTTMPVTFGLLRPHILLPANAATWTPDKLRMVLSHELAHIKRRDCLTLYLAQIARALHWFNPLAYVAISRMLAERERACDDLVLRATSTRPSDYADTLLHLTASLRPAPLLLTAMPMARASHLHTRLLAVLDPQRNRSPLTRRLTIAVLLLCPLIALPLACSPDPKPSAASMQPVPGTDGDYGWTPETSLAAKNLRMIGQAIQLYADKNDLHLPPTLGATLSALGGNPADNAHFYLDPQKNQSIPANPTPDWIDKHTPYVYLGNHTLRLTDMPNPPDAGSTTILVHEDLDHPHQHPKFGPLVLALYNDGHGEILPLLTARGQIYESKKTLAGIHPGAASGSQVDQYGWTQEMNDAQGPMRDIALAAGNYANEHHDRLPATLGDVLPYLDRNHAMGPADHRHATPGEKARMFADPRSQAVSPIPDNPSREWVNAQTTYTYLGRAGVDQRSFTDAQTNTTILLHGNLDAPYRHPINGQMIICAYVDGHSEAFPIEAARQHIARSREAFAAAANKPPRTAAAPSDNSVAGHTLLKK